VFQVALFVCTSFFCDDMILTAGDVCLFVCLTLLWDFILYYV
jgi:hypothetical protein